MWHPCPECATCITSDRLYDPSTCAPCQTFLDDMQQNPSASSLASKTWMKWNRTLVNRWKKNNVALYSPPTVRMLIWADSSLFHTYEAVLPPAPPPRSTSKDSLCSVGQPDASPAPSVDPLLPWTPSWTRIGVPPGLALTKFSHLTRRPGLGPPLSYYRNRHFPCRHLRRRRSPHSRNHPQTR